MIDMSIMRREKRGYIRQLSSGEQKMMDWKYPHIVVLAGVITELVFDDDFVMVGTTGVPRFTT